MVAQLDAPFDWRLGGHGFNTRRGQQLSFMEIDPEFFLWSFSAFFANSKRAVVSFWQKNVHNTGQPFRGQSLPSKHVVR